MYGLGSVPHSIAEDGGHASLRLVGCVVNWLGLESLQLVCILIYTGTQKNAQTKAELILNLFIYLPIWVIWHCIFQSRVTKAAWPPQFEWLLHPAFAPIYCNYLLICFLTGFLQAMGTIKKTIFCCYKSFHNFTSDFSIFFVLVSCFFHWFDVGGTVEVGRKRWCPLITDIHLNQNMMEVVRLFADIASTTAVNPH